MAKYREIEKKYRLSGNRSLKECTAIVRNVLIAIDEPHSSILDCKTIDTYWKPSEPSTMTLARVRDSVGQRSDGEFTTLKELTIKQKDLGHNVDRLEINLGIDNTVDATALVSGLLGTKPTGVINKIESIFLLENEAVISVAEILDHPGQLFLEIEAPNLALVQIIEDQLISWLDATLVPESLYELFIAKEVA